MTKDPRYVVYSLRHEWKNRALDSDIDPRLSGKMRGHAAQTVTGEYGNGASIRKLAAEMDKLDTSFVDWPRLLAAAGRA